MDARHPSPLSILPQVRLKAKGGDFIKVPPQFNTPRHVRLNQRGERTGCTHTCERCTLIIKRRRGRSRLVAVLPPPGMINVSSHLITTWPAALARDGWRSVNGRGGDCVLGLKLAMIPPQGFARTCRDCANTHVHTEKVHTCAPTVHFLLWTLHILFLSLMVTFFYLYACFFSCYVNVCLWNWIVWGCLRIIYMSYTEDFLHTLSPCLLVFRTFASELIWILNGITRALLPLVSLTPLWILMASAPTHATFSFFAGDLRLRPAGAGDEVDRPVDVGASDVPHASEHNAALCQTQSQD